MSLAGRRALVAALTAMVFLVIFWGFYPGHMSPDSVTQMRQAVSRQFNDHHPVVVAWLWSVLYRIWPGPQPMLLMQALFLSGALGFLGWVLARRWRNPLAVAFPLIALLPFVLNFSGVIWKDVQLADSFLLATAILIALASADAPRPWVRGLACAAALMLILYGSMARHGSATLCLPFMAVIVATAALPASWTARRRARARWLLVAAVTVGFVAAGVVFSAALTRVPSYSQQYLYLYDLSGISVRLDRPVFPEYVLRSPDFSFDEVRSRYNMTDVNLLIYGTVRERPPLPLTFDADNVSRLGETWRKAVREHPAEWLRHRAALYVSFLGWNRPTSYPVHWGIDPRAGLAVSDNAGRDLLRSYLFSMSQSFLFKSWFWLTVALAGFLAAWKAYFRTRSPVVLAAWMLFAGGLVFELSYFVAAVATDARYIYWTVLSSCVAWLLLAGEWWNSRASGKQGSVA